MKKILAGDVGGTKTRLALFDARGDELHLIEERTLPSRDYDSLEKLLEAFHGGRSFPEAAACFGVPGPVRHGRAQVTNLPWTVDAQQLGRSLRSAHVFLLNDLEASAHYLEVLPPGQQLTLQEGEPGAAGNAALISAGTGLGEAGLFWDGERWHPFPSEGGHAGFAPAGELDFAFLRWLQQRFGEHVSWERVLSGPGLVNTYRFLREWRQAEEPPWLAEEMREEDPAAVISRAGMERRSELCADALDLFVGYYGAEAGNLALKLLATGGVFLGGGIAPKIAERLKSPHFLARFRAKGRMSDLVAKMPVRVILDPRASLCGPAHYAARQIGA